MKDPQSVCDTPAITVKLSAKFNFILVLSFSLSLSFFLSLPPSLLVEYAHTINENQLSSSNNHFFCWCCSFSLRFHFHLMWRKARGSWWLVIKFKHGNEFFGKFFHIFFPFLIAVSVIIICLWHESTLVTWVSICHPYFIFLGHVSFERKVYFSASPRWWLRQKTRKQKTKYTHRQPYARTEREKAREIEIEKSNVERHDPQCHSSASFIYELNY